jgi:hypothetical protein
MTPPQRTLARTAGLIMSIHSRGVAFPQDYHGLFSALGVGSDKSELAFVKERRGVGLDYLARQVIAGKT